MSRKINNHQLNIVHWINKALGKRAYSAVKSFILKVPGGSSLAMAMGLTLAKKRTKTGARTQFLRLHFSSSRSSWDGFRSHTININRLDQGLSSFDIPSIEAESVQDIWWEDDSPISGDLLAEFFRLLMPGGRLHIYLGCRVDDVTAYGFKFLSLNKEFKEFFKVTPLPSDYSQVNEESWDQVIEYQAERLTLEWRQHHLSYKAAQEVLDMLKPQKVVSFGCGISTLEILISDEVDFILGIDISANALCKGQQLQINKKKPVALLNASGRIPLMNSTFDLCILTQVMEHIYPDDIRNILHEIKRILRPGGHLYITVPNGQEYWDPGHVQFYTKSLLLQTAQKNNWEVAWTKVDERKDRYRRHGLLKALWTKPVESQ